MRPIVGQTPEQVLGQRITPEQNILWQHIFNVFRPSVIQPLYFEGHVATSDFVTYAATKLYIAYSIIMTSDSNYASTAANVLCPLYNEANVMTMQFETTCVYWDATAAAVRNHTATKELTNVYFSRVGNMPVFPKMRFIGYQITY